jgi:hypothetical protein
LPSVLVAPPSPPSSSADGGCAAGDGTAIYPHGSGRIVPDSPQLTGRGGGCGSQSGSVRAINQDQRKLHPCWYNWCGSGVGWGSFRGVLFCLESLEVGVDRRRPIV